MRNKKLSLFAIALLLMVIFPVASASANDADQDMDIWLKDNMNPKVVKVVKEYNKTSQVNWNVNLSRYLIDKDKKLTVKKLNVFRDDISDIKNEIKEIELPDTADKKERKKVREVKKNLYKTLKRSDKDAKRLLKRFDKDKKVDVIPERKKQKKTISKANNAFVSLNEFNDIKVERLQIDYAEKISEAEAKGILQKHEEEQKKIAAAKEKKKKEKAAKEAAKAEKRAIEDKENQAKREEERKKAKEKVSSIITDMIQLGSGLIKDIKPASGDDWIAVFVYVDNSWHLLSAEEKKYTAETIGPVISQAIIETGITDYSDVHFVDQNGNKVASPKFWGGGYKIKN